MSRLTRPLALALGLALPLVAVACGDDDNEGTTNTAAPSATTAAASDTSAAGGGTSDLSGQSITVGSGNFSESVLLGEIYAGALKGAGADIKVTPNIGTREVYYAAIESGEISLIPEYTGSLLGFVDKAATAKTTADQVTALKETLPDTLTVLEPSTAQDKDVIVCNQQTADQYDLKGLSDLKDAGPNIVLGGPPEFAERTTFGIPALQSAGITFKEFKPLEIGPPLFDALTANAVNCANLFSTDAFLSGNDKVVPLEDDIDLAGDESVLPLIRTQVATPGVTDLLNQVSAKIDTDGLTALNAKVQSQGLAETEVAAQWLKDNNLAG